MKLNYYKILNKNMVNVFKDVLKNIEINGLKEDHHLYITFKTNDKNVIIPDWLKVKFPYEMTIVIQYEYWNFKVYNNCFNICLSFNNIKCDLKIHFKSVISFADPYANFGLKLINKELDKKQTKQSLQKKYDDQKIDSHKDNIIEFNKFKKN